MKHLLLLFFCTPALFAQIRITRVDVLPLGTAQEWHAPEFSPDGRSLFVTTSTYSGIWKYTLASRSLEQITAEPRSGYGFAVSPDGAQIAYRRTSPTGGRQELVLKTIKSGAVRVAASGKEVSLPSYAAGTLAYVTENRVQVADEEAVAGRVVVLGIENTRIVLLREGKRVLLDPLGGGSYIWPTLSPDGTRLAAVEMSRGAFVSDPDGRNVLKLGRCDAPSWSRNGRWIVYMDDRDDGHRILSSDLFAVESGGGRQVQLTATPDRMEMFPRCSPVDDRIVCSTPEGSILMIEYEEVVR